ncbi:RAD52 family DNA repair protein [Ktedonospora formicarum]|uniref:Uncharacterized protein n=1 Tax=Ktedonospora formicarum TaxID=2778364 RepID=A0A8J3MRK7_9CHLR|nr:RAD52 family DNA repair protein [Ktedonospora formicarum]GHO45160.1 hypothetical protein KSX_33230 [Ktedonospora formicarum]
MSSNYVEIQGRLAQPFALEQLDFRAGGRGTALVYVELWDYFTRLDRDCPGEWEVGKPEVIQSTEYTNKDGEPVNLMALLVPLTIAGKTVHGISDLKSPTSAYAQAIKRAASVHGLGRYLYDAPTLDNAYQGYNLVVDKSVLLAKCYQAWGIELPEGFEVVEAAPARPQQQYQTRQSEAPRQQQQYVQIPQAQVQQSNGEQNPVQHDGKISIPQVRKLYSVGINDEDIKAMSTQNARQAVNDAFAGITAAQIREKYLSAAPSGGRARW